MSGKKKAAKAERKAAAKVVATFGAGAVGRSVDTFNESASFTRREMRNWRPYDSRNPDDEIAYERPECVARARDAYRNQSIARAAVNTPVTSVVGGGLEMHCRINRAFLGFGDDDETATAWEQNTERLFRDWADSIDPDARARNTFYQLQHMAFKSKVRDGEIFALMPIVPRRNSICDLRVLLVECSRVSTPWGMTNGPLYPKPTEGTRKLKGSLWDGIETGVWGEPIAYHFETTVPVPFLEPSRSWERVAAFGSKSGRRQVLHFYDEERPGQRRGMPSLTPVLSILKQIARYSEAELAAAVLSAMFTVFIKHANPNSEILPSSEGKDGEREHIELGRGAVVDLQEGEDVEFANPGRPNQVFGQFVGECIKQIAMGVNLPYEVLTKHFSSSYSASRAAIMQAWEVFMIERGWFVSSFCQPIYVEWLSHMVATKRISCPGFFQSVEVQRAYCRAEWYGPVPLQIDPVKEATGGKIRIETGISTVAEETARWSGGDWEKNFHQRRREKDLAQSLGLEMVTPVAEDSEPVFEPEPGE